MTYTILTKETSTYKPVGELDECPHECVNPVCEHNTSDYHRAELLKEYLNSLPVDPLLMPRTKDGKKPIIQERGVALDSEEGQDLLVTAQEAQRQIREEGVTGFCLYAGKPSHNTEELVFADHDDMDSFPLDTLPDTLTVRSGSGEGYHETFLKNNEIENAKAKGDMSGAGEIRASNWLVVTPGSIHPSGGIYHTVSQRKVATLSNEDIPSELQKQTYSEKDIGELDEEVLENTTVDTQTVETAMQYLNRWKDDGHLSAFYCLHDRLQGGRGDYGHEFDGDGSAGKIDRDLQEKTILTHLYGIFHEAGYSEPRSKELTSEILTYYCKESNNGNTKDGQPRKWLLRGIDYRTEQVKHAASQFDSDQFQRFKNKTTKAVTKHRRLNNEYSDVTRGIALFIVDLASGVFEGDEPEVIHEFVSDYGFSLTVDEVRGVVGCVKGTHMYNDTRGSSVNTDTSCEYSYPQKSTVSEICERVDGVYKGNTKRTFADALQRLQKEGVIKVACIREGMEYVVYPFNHPDPPGAEWVRFEGEEWEPGEI